MLFLPPYSPDLNPIELGWAKLKGALKDFRARTRDALDFAYIQRERFLGLGIRRALFHQYGNTLVHSGGPTWALPGLKKCPMRSPSTMSVPPLMEPKRPTKPCLAWTGMSST